MKEAEKQNEDFFVSELFLQIAKKNCVCIFYKLYFFTNIDIGSLCEVWRGKTRKKLILVSMILLDQYSVMHILGFFLETLVTYMTSREDSIGQRNGEGTCFIIMMDISLKIRFLLFVLNSIERHNNNQQGSYFFSSKKFLGNNLPTIE